MAFNLSYTAQDLNAAVAKANAAAPQSTTYTKNEVDTALSGKANTSDLGSAATKGFDVSPTSGNTNNAVSSDGVYQALSQKAGLDVVEHYSLSSSNPVVMDASRYSMFFVFGLAQGVGRFTSMLSVNIDDTVSWTMYGTSTQPSNITVSYDNATHKLTMQSSSSSESKITVVKCIV